MNNEQNTQAGAAALTEKQIAAGAIVRCDHGGSIGRSAAIEVFDAIRAAAPVAAQAGQVAVPEGWAQYKRELLGAAFDLTAGLIAVPPEEIDEEGFELIRREPAMELVTQWRTRVDAANREFGKVAAAPAAPAQAKPLPAESIDTPGVRALLVELAAWGGAGGMVKANEFVGRAAAALRTEASTADVRSQEGGA